LFRVWSISTSGYKGYLTQEETNNYFEPPQTDFARKYGEQIAIVCTTAFYCAYYPIGIIITLAGISIRYFVDKFLFLYRYKKPEALSHEIALWTMDNLSYFFIVIIVILLIN